MTAIEILKGVGTLARASRHIKNQDNPDLPRSARLALSGAATLLDNASARLMLKEADG